MNIVRISKEEWKEKYAEKTHTEVFNTPWTKDFERLDFALLTFEGDSKVQFATVRELDKETAYIQYGGSFPDYRGSINSWKSFGVVLDYLDKDYKGVGFLTENTNFPMLKFAIKKEFAIVGVRVVNGRIYLEHFKRRE